MLICVPFLKIQTVISSMEFNLKMQSEFQTMKTLMRLILFLKENSDLYLQGLPRPICLETKGKYYITQTCLCNMQQFSMAVKTIFFR